MKTIKQLSLIMLLLMFSLNIFASNSYADDEAKNLKGEAVSSVTETVVPANNNVITNENNMFSDFKEITKEDCIKNIDNGNISYIGKTSQLIYFITNDNNKYFIKDVDGDLIPYMTIKGLDIETVTIPNASVQEDSGVNMFGFVVVLTLISFGVIFFYRAKKRSSLLTIPSSSNKSEAARKADEIPKVKFADVEGVEELKNDVFRLVDCLKNPDKYEAIGARTPKGVILYGPPGTGKTLLAKAIAGEAEVPFFSAVGSDFVEKYVGVGAKRVRELYKKAKQNAPCIVFIDEVDAVAAKRGGENNTESDQTINALLAELDGFSSSARIITICATNRLDMLDSAFKRAGRFDLKLAVGLPDKDSRYKILCIHARNKKLNEEVNLKIVAVKTSGFSGAELEALLNEAALSAVGKNKELIDNEDIDDAFFKIVMQGNKKKRTGITEMNRIIAWHEAGHTLATKLLTDDSVPSVTIIGSSSGAGGVTFRTPKDEGLQSKKYLKSLIGVMYAGRVAEELYQGEGNEDLITNGASQDIKQATDIIKQYLAIYGMGDMGMLDMTQLKGDFGSIIVEASALAKEIYSSTFELLKTNILTLDAIANKLLEKETLDEVEIDDIIESQK